MIRSVELSNKATQWIYTHNYVIIKKAAVVATSYATIINLFLCFNVILRNREGLSDCASRFSFVSSAFYRDACTFMYVSFMYVGTFLTNIVYLNTLHYTRKQETM